MKTYPITQRQINILASTCLDADLKCKTWFTDAFKIEILNNCWIKTEGIDIKDWLYYLSNGEILFGFHIGGWHDEIQKYTPDCSDMKATAQEVKTALIAEAEKRGFVVGAKFYHCEIKDKNCEIKEDLKFYSNLNILTDSCGGIIFYDGIWATIIEQPLTIEQRIEILEKKLNNYDTKRI